ncbi:hypothetical protein TI05_09055 [Achromatium sp. WMS3]|nr:hypothetical protein TI05_09055 [Achromatium sp. WMS3]
MMQYLLDTVVVIRHFSGTGQIGQAANEILEKFEQTTDIKLIISAISLMEIMYLAEKIGFQSHYKKPLPLFAHQANT